MKPTLGWLTLASRCGSLRLAIREMELRDGRLIFVATGRLDKDHETDEWSRAVIAGRDEIEYGNFPYRGDQIDLRAGDDLTVTFPTGIVDVHER